MASRALKIDPRTKKSGSNQQTDNLPHNRPQTVDQTAIAALAFQIWALIYLTHPRRQR